MQNDENVFNKSGTQRCPVAKDLQHTVLLNHLTLQTYLNDITTKRFRDALVRLCFGINELRVNKRYVSQNIVNKDSAFCPGTPKDETLPA